MSQITRPSQERTSTPGPEPYRAASSGHTATIDLICQLGNDPHTFEIKKRRLTEREISVLQWIEMRANVTVQEIAKGVRIKEKYVTGTGLLCRNFSPAIALLRSPA
jgi:hypothetical protein